MKRVVAMVATALVVTSCMQADQADMRLEEDVPPDFQSDTGDVIYNFPEFEYEYARAEALQRTNLEPSPTSYVLFPRYKLTEPITEVSPDTEEAFSTAQQEQYTRINAYCLQHYKHFGSLVGSIESDPFANLVTFYWLVSAADEDALEVLGDTTITSEERCEFLTKNYDFDRAEGLLDSLLGKELAAKTVGPVLVLDVGFHALAVPMDNVKTEDMVRIPPIWKQSIDNALANVRITRQQLIDDLNTINREISELKSKAEDRKARRSERKRANEQLQSKKAERKSLLSRLFGPNSWGRAILCGFSGVVISATQAWIPNMEPIKKKVDGICSSTG